MFAYRGRNVCICLYISDVVAACVYDGMSVLGRCICPYISDVVAACVYDGMSVY